MGCGAVLENILENAEDMDWFPRVNRILKGGVVIPLIFPKVPQSSRPESLGSPGTPTPLKNPIMGG